MKVKNVEVIFEKANTLNDSYEAKDSECDRLSISFYSPAGVIQNNVNLYRIIYPIEGEKNKTYSDKTIAFHNIEHYYPERIEFVKTLARDAVLGNITLDTLKKIVRIFISLESIGFNFDINNKDSCIEFYKKYSDYLYSQARQSNIKGNGLKRRTAAVYQYAIQFALSRAHKEPINKWKDVYYLIDIKKSEDGLPSLNNNSGDFQLVYSFFLRFFNKTTDYLLSGSNKPLYIEFKDLGLDNLVFISASSHSWKYNENLTFRYIHPLIENENDTYEWHIIKNKLDKLNTNISEYDKEKIRSLLYKIRTNGLTQQTLKTIANKAVFAFIKIFIAETGANPSHIENLDLSSEKIESELGHFRILAQKGRAGHEVQPIRMSVSFLPLWKKYLKLRKWMIDQLIDQNDPKVGVLRYSSGLKTLELIGSGPISQKANYFTPDNLPNISARSFRKYKSQKITDAADGDIKISSKILNQTEQTAARHYTSAKFETTAKEFKKFFIELKEFSKLHVQDKNGLPPIVENALEIKTGRCNGLTSNDAIKIENMDKRTPNPRCGTPIHCFFCKSFGIHREVKDLKKLICARKWIEYQARTKTEGIEIAMKKYSPITQRIDAIIDEFIIMDEKNKEMFLKAEMEVQQGKIDQYWKNKLNAILDTFES